MNTGIRFLKMHGVFPYICFVGLSLISLVSPAQTTSSGIFIYGTVVERDSANQTSPLEAVEVLVSIPKQALFKHSEKSEHSDYSESSDSVILSTLTDVNGKFSIPLSPATYHLTYRQMGNILRQDTLKVTQSRNLGNIVIDPQSIKLNEVVVKAQKKLLTYQQGMLAFNVVESPYAEGFNAKDVLQHMPGMDPDPNKISMIGKDGLIVLINGRRTNLTGDQLKQYLQSIESDKIEKIEIQTNPSPEYAASGNPGVINIVLKKNAYLGWDGSVRAMYLQHRKLSFGTGGNINFSNKYISISYLGNYNYLNFRQVNMDKYDFTDTLTIHRDTTDLQKIHATFHNLSFNYFINEQMDLGFQSYFYLSEDHKTDGSSSNMTYYRDTLLNVYVQTFQNDASYRWISVSPYYEWRFGNNGKKMTITYDYSLSTSPKDNQSYLDKQTLNRSVFTSNSKTTSHLGKIDFKLPFTWLGFELGGSYGYTHNYAESNYDRDQRSYSYNERIGAFYIDIYKSWERFNFKVGTRYEHTTFKGIPNDTLSFKKQYGNWFPFVDLGFNIQSKHIITLGYNRKISRPWMRQYNPVRTYTNGLSYQQGNPNLKPTIKDNVELKYMFSNLYVSLEYSHGKDGIVTVHSVENDSVTSMTYGNGLSFHRAGGTVSYSYYHKRFSLSGGGTVYYYKYHSSNNRVSNEDLKGWSPRLFINGSVNIGKHTMLTANYWCDLKGFGGVFDEDIPVRNQFKHSFDIGANWKFLEGKLVLDIRVQDILGTNIDRHRSVLVSANGKRYVHYNQSSFTSRFGMVTLSYRFGNNKTKRTVASISAGNERNRQQK